jgi:hypothetical protein
MRAAASLRPGKAGFPVAQLGRVRWSLYIPYVRPMNAAAAHTHATSSSPASNEFLLKPNRHPVLWAAIAYSAGIVAGIHCVRPPAV